LALKCDRRNGAHVVALAIDGESWSSGHLAAHMEHQAVYGGSSINFVIGGSLVLSPAILARADNKLSFGRMTYPHPYDAGAVAGAGVPGVQHSYHCDELARLHFDGHAV
jgi:rRNA large subunit m3Psi methyltransferase RlmH